MQEKVAGAQIDGLQKDTEDFRQLTPFAQSRSFRTELWEDLFIKVAFQRRRDVLNLPGIVVIVASWHNNSPQSVPNISDFEFKGVTVDKSLLLIWIIFVVSIPQEEVIHNKNDDIEDDKHNPDVDEGDLN